MVVSIFALEIQHIDLPPAYIHDLPSFSMMLNAISPSSDHFDVDVQIMAIDVLIELVHHGMWIFVDMQQGLTILQILLPLRIVK